MTGVWSLVAQRLRNLGPARVGWPIATGPRLGDRWGEFGIDINFREIEGPGEPAIIQPNVCPSEGLFDLAHRVLSEFENVVNLCLDHLPREAEWAHAPSFGHQGRDAIALRGHLEVKASIIDDSKQYEHDLCERTHDRLVLQIRTRYKSLNKNTTTKC